MVRAHVSVFAEAAGAGEANTAARILDAAIHEFDEYGFGAASLARVAERGRVTKSLVSYHYPTKLLLGTAVLNLAYPGGVFMGVLERPRDPFAAILQSSVHVANQVIYNPLARAALSLDSPMRLGGDRAS